jgi:hypothetical protein
MTQPEILNRFFLSIFRRIDVLPHLPWISHPSLLCTLRCNHEGRRLSERQVRSIPSVIIGDLPPDLSFFRNHLFCFLSLCHRFLSSMSSFSPRKQQSINCVWDSETHREIYLLSKEWESHRNWNAMNIIFRNLYKTFLVMMYYPKSFYKDLHPIIS